MKKFIKENQIIIAIVLASIILGGFYYISQLNKQKSIEKKQVSNFELQAKCAVQATESFNYFVVDPKENQEDTYINHYNLKYNKCFILIKYPIGIENKDGIYMEDLYDAVEKKPYGSFWVKIPTWDKPIACEMLDKFCNSRTEWDAFVKTYMEN